MGSGFESRVQFCTCLLDIQVETLNRQLDRPAWSSGRVRIREIK